MKLLSKIISGLLLTASAVFGDASNFNSRIVTTDKLLVFGTSSNALGGSCVGMLTVTNVSNLTNLDTYVLLSGGAISRITWVTNATISSGQVALSNATSTAQAATNLYGRLPTMNLSNAPLNSVSFSISTNSIFIKGTNLTLFCTGPATNWGKWVITTNAPTYSAFASSGGSSSEAGHATNADVATRAGMATNANEAAHATNSNVSTTSGYSTNSGVATEAFHATNANVATSSGLATNAQAVGGSSLTTLSNLVNSIVVGSNTTLYTAESNSFITVSNNMIRVIDFVRDGGAQASTVGFGVAFNNSTIFSTMCVKAVTEKLPLFIPCSDFYVLNSGCDNFTNLHIIIAGRLFATNWVHDAQLTSSERATIVRFANFDGLDIEPLFPGYSGFYSTFQETNTSGVSGISFDKLNSTASSRNLNIRPGLVVSNMVHGIDGTQVVNNWRIVGYIARDNGNTNNNDGSDIEMTGGTNGLLQAMDADSPAANAGFEQYQSSIGSNSVSVQVVDCNLRNQQNQIVGTSYGGPIERSRIIVSRCLFSSDQNRPSRIDGTGTGVNVSGWSNSLVDSCMFNYPTNGPAIAITVAGTENTPIRNCTIYTKYTGVQATGNFPGGQLFQNINIVGFNASSTATFQLNQTTNVTIDGGNAYGSFGNGVVLTDAYNTKIRNHTMTGASSRGLQLNPTWGVLSLENVDFRGNGEDGHNYGNTGSVYFVNCHFDEFAGLPSIYSSSTSNEVVIPETNVVQAVKFGDNTVQSSAGVSAGSTTYFNLTNTTSTGTFTFGGYVILNSSTISSSTNWTTEAMTNAVYLLDLTSGAQSNVFGSTTPNANTAFGGAGSIKTYYATNTAGTFDTRLVILDAGTTTKSTFVDTGSRYLKLTSPFVAKIRQVYSLGTGAARTNLFSADSIYYPPTTPTPIVFTNLATITTPSQRSQLLIQYDGAFVAASGALIVSNATDGTALSNKYTGVTFAGSVPWASPIYNPNQTLIIYTNANGFVITGVSINGL